MIRYTTAKGSDKRKDMINGVFEYLYNTKNGTDENSKVNDRYSQYKEFARYLDDSVNTKKNVEDFTTDDQKPTLTFNSVMPKAASSKIEKASDYLGEKASENSFLSKGLTIKPAEIDDWIRKHTGSPLIRSALAGVLAGTAMAAAHNKIDTMLGGERMPAAEDNSPYAEYIREKKRKSRNKAAAWTGITTAALATLLSVNPDTPGSWHTYYPKLGKTASMLGSFEYISKDDARKAILMSNQLNSDQRYQALKMLDAIPGSGSTRINSTDIVNAAMYTGASAISGVPLGRIVTAAIADAAAGYGLGRLIGVPNPGSLATTMGMFSASNNIGKFF